MRGYFNILAGLLGLIAAAPASANEGYSNSIAGWKILGSNGLCLAGSPMVNDELINLAIVGDGLVLGLDSPLYDRGGTRSVSTVLAIDGRWQRRFSASEMVSEGLIFEFGLSDPVVGHLRNGNHLRVESGRTILKFDLTGSAAAIASLWECGRQVGALPANTENRQDGGASGRTGSGSGDLPPREIALDAGGWSGAAHFEESGTFRNCVMAGPQVGTVWLLFLHSHSGLWVALQSEDWALDIGAVYPLTVSIDGQWQAELEGEAIGDDSILISIVGEPAAVERLRYGNRLVVEAAQQTFRFSLRGSNAAIQALAGCYAEHGGAAVAARPPEEPRPTADPVPGVASRGPQIVTGVYRIPLGFNQEEAEAMIHSRIAPSATVWPAGENPPYFEFAGNTALRGEGAVTGRMMAVHVPSGLIELAMTALYADRADACGLGAESGILPAESFPEIDLQYAIVKCSIGGRHRQTELVLMMADTGGLLYEIEGGYTDTYRMADLVLSIQAVGRGEVQ